MLVSLEEFLVLLREFYKNARKGKRHSVWVTYKRYHPSIKTKTTIHNDRTKQLPKCLVRATNGKRKISSLITQEMVPKFLSAISMVTRQEMELN